MKRSKPHEFYFSDSGTFGSINLQDKPKLRIEFRHEMIYVRLDEYVKRFTYGPYDMDCENLSSELKNFILNKFSINVDQSHILEGLKAYLEFNKPII